MVDDAVEKNPFVNASVVDVLLYPEFVVNGNARPFTVTAPVAPDTVMFVPATIDVTPVLVTLPFEYARPDEKVVVAPE